MAQELKTYKQNQTKAPHLKQLHHCSLWQTLVPILHPLSSFLSLVRCFCLSAIFFSILLTLGDPRILGLFFSCGPNRARTLALSTTVCFIASTPPGPHDLALSHAVPGHGSVNNPAHRLFPIGNMEEATLQRKGRTEDLACELSYASYPQDKERDPSAVKFRNIDIALFIYPYSYLL